jgi:ferredoxin--NADP+ reductase
MILPARRFINWYNCALESNLDPHSEFNLEQIRDLLIIGNGNITCDFSRMLLRNPSDFDETDMHSTVLDWFKRSKITNI